MQIKMLRGTKIGEGTFGIVYSGNTGGKKIAVKRNLVEDQTSFIGVLREVHILNELRSYPHVVRLEIVSFGNPFHNTIFSPLSGEERNSQRDDTIHFIFGEAAYDLHRYIYGASIQDFSLNKRYMVHILLAMEYIHGHKIIHRDIKPSNILIFGDEADALGVCNVAKICDFGLSKPYTYQGSQTPCTVTSWYRAPEIALGYPHYDYKVDVWAVGCVFFEMAARRAFIPNVPDDNDDILSSILGALPQELSMRKFRELIRSNKWRRISLRPSYTPKTRRSFAEQIGFDHGGLAKFEKEAGRFASFCDLLNKMLTFEWDQRITITECLNHDFFRDYADVINYTRKKYPPRTVKYQPITICSCMERKWMSDAVTDIFNNRGSFRWYTHRALFQAMDLFDRYLTAMFQNTTIPSHAVESNLKGLIHDKYGSDLRFMTCLYSAIKFFSSIQYPVPFDNIVSKEFCTKEAKLIAEQFEGAFIKSCLQFEIYQPTVYECADEFNDKLDDVDVRNLIILYSMNDTFSGMTHCELYQYYRTYLKGASVEMLLAPIAVPRKHTRSTQ